MTYTRCVRARTKCCLQAGSVYTRLCIFTALLFVLVLTFPSIANATTVTATWNANPEANVAGYQLMYGTASGSYTTVIDVGKVTSFSFSVTGGVTYYFVLQAYNTSGVYSPYSAEVSFLVPLPASPSISSVSPSSGAVGTVVTIAGSNLGSSSSGNSVTFNGVAASPTSWSSSSIVATVPAGASSGNVVAKVAGVPSNGLSFTVSSSGSGSGGGSGGGGSSGGSGGGGGLSAFSGTPVSIPGGIEAANFDNGGEGIAYHDSTPGNAGGQYRQTDVDIEAAGSSEGGYDVGWTTPGEWLNYTVNVTSAGNYTVQLRVASPSGATMHLGFNNASNVWKTISIPATGGWQTWQTVNVPVTLGAGVQQMTVYFDTGGMNLRYAIVFSGSGGSGGGGGGLPSPWQNQDVGSVGVAGSTSYSGGVFTVRGAGADIWGSADAFQFAYRTQTGDDYFMAHVTSVQNTSPFAKAGVMIRSSTSAGAADVIIDVKPDGGIEFMSRSSDGGSTTWYNGWGATVPVWLALVRSGSAVYAYAAADGGQWLYVGGVNMSLPATVDGGLVVTSHSTQQLNTATFDNVH
jgi:hypothetical protein